MPLYEYRCQRCRKVSEILQSLDEAPARICPHCGGRLKKMHSTPSIRFKGTGWYVTDYAGKGRAPQSEGGSAEKSGESKPESPKEDKPAPKKSAAKKE